MKKKITLLIGIVVSTILLTGCDGNVTRDIRHAGYSLSQEDFSCSSLMPVDDETPASDTIMYSNECSSLCQSFESAHHTFLSGRTSFYNGMKFSDPTKLCCFPNGLMISAPCYNNDFCNALTCLKCTHCISNHICISQRHQDLIFSLHPCSISCTH